MLTVPNAIWNKIFDNGFDWIWLMGVWKHSTLSEKELAKHPGLVSEITHSLPDWESSDVIGSPYSIVKYELNPLLGKPGDLEALKHKLNDFGVKLMLDFVPNHFGSESELIRIHPEYFISTKNLPSDQSLFKKVETVQGEQWIAYGKDPYYSPWTDTFQLNYFNENTRQYMVEVLNQIANKCDGIRCDMAMLCLNETIQQTWGLYIQETEINNFTSSEFWTSAINRIKKIHPEFIFLAEVYWNLGVRLQQMGFDYTYDKDLYDKLEAGSVKEIQTHFTTDKAYHKKTLKFIENHDERRALDTFGKDRSIAAAIVMGTVPGMSLYYQGQLEGEKVKIPVQLRRKQSEKPDSKIQEAYYRILEYTRQLRIQNFQWSLLSPSNPNILAWNWYSSELSKIYLIVVNYSSSQSIGNVFLPLLSEQKNVRQFGLYDALAKVEYLRQSDDLRKHGLFVDLQPYQSHLFVVDPL